MSAPCEASPLVKLSPRRKHTRCCSCHVQYRLPRIKEKGAIVVIVCNVLILISVFVQFQRSYLMSSTFTIALPLMSIITFPIAGIVADTCVGRLKVIQASAAFVITSSLLNMLLVLVQDYLNLTTVTAFVLLIEGLCCIGISCYSACLLPFTGDQLIGASGEQLSFAMYWMMWGFVIAYHTILLSFISLHEFEYVAPLLALLCISTMAFILWRWKSSLNTIHQLSNPYKLIFRVLHYSWKHKYPERRSALYLLGGKYSISH